MTCLSWVVYADRWDWRSEEIAWPTWEQVEGSIRRLDKFHYPWVWLFICDTHGDSTVNCLTVMGGNGTYWVALSAARHDQLRLYDPAKSENEVDLWTSDQGFSDCECYVTHDLDLILRIARYFGETGKPLPAATWEVKTL